MIIKPKLKVYVDWFGNEQYSNETALLSAATFQLFNVDMTSSLEPKAKPTSGQITFVNKNGRFSLNSLIPNKDTELESALSDFPVNGVNVIITLEDNSDPDMISDKPIFYGSLTSPSGDSFSITFKLQNKLSGKIQRKRTTETFQYKSTSELIELFDDTGLVYPVAASPTTVEYSSLDNESSINAILKMMEASLAYVVSDNSPVINVYPHDYMLVQPLEPIIIDVRQIAESRTQFVSRMNIFDEIVVDYTPPILNAEQDLIRDKQPIIIEAGAVNEKHELKLSSQLVGNGDVDYDVVSNGDATLTTISYQLYGNTIVFTVSNSDTLLSYITNIRVNGISVSFSKKEKVTHPIVQDPNFSRTFATNKYIQNKLQADWIATTLGKRMERFGQFNDDFVIIKNAIPNEKYVFGRPVILIDEYGRQIDYYLFSTTARFSSTQGLWMDLTLVSKNYLYGDTSGDAGTCGKPYIIGVDQLDNTKVCMI